MRGEDGIVSEGRTTRKRNVTIKDVAREIGLSITTVSRALGGYPDVGAESRKRVIAAAEQLGYRPNRNAQRLVTRRTHVLAWIQSDNDRIFVDPHFAEVMAGVLRAVRDAKYDVILSSDTAERQIAAYDRYMHDNSVDGFLLHLPRVEDERVPFLIESGRPFVVHGRERANGSYHWVDIDNFGIYRALTYLMLDNGHRRIAFINGDEQFAYAFERRRGVMAALAERGLPENAVRIYNSVHPMGEAGFRLTAQALADGKTDAIIYSSALMTVEGQAALAQAGHICGETIAVASMDDRLHHFDLTPYAGRISFARSSLREAGRALAETLIRVCEANTPPSGTVIPVMFDLANGIDGSALSGVDGLVTELPAP